MKKNKEIEKFAENSMKELVIEEFYRELSALQSNAKEEEKETQMKKPFYKRLSSYFALASTGIVTAVVLLCVFLIPPAIPPTPPIPSYGFGNQVSVQTTIETLNAKLNEIQIIGSNVKNATIVSDAPSGDELYYHILWENEAETSYRSGDISIVGNPYYEYVKEPTTEVLIYKEIPIQYVLSEDSDGDGFITQKLYAYLEIGSYRIGVTYEEYTFEDPTGFIDFLDHFFIFE